MEELDRPHSGELDFTWMKKWLVRVLVRANKLSLMGKCNFRGFYEAYLQASAVTTALLTFL